MKSAMMMPMRKMAKMMRMKAEKKKTKEKTTTTMMIKAMKEKKSTKKAAAAMCVGMGSFCDPLEAQSSNTRSGGLRSGDPKRGKRGVSTFSGSLSVLHIFLNTCFSWVVQNFQMKMSMTVTCPSMGAPPMHTQKLSILATILKLNQNIFLQGALRRFSQFFISPFVKNEAMDREVQAVDSETLDVVESWVLELFSKVKTSNALKSEVKPGLPIWRVQEKFIV
ncbi:unnamed protein product [Lactuca virosa]|uniref:Uncharacterized protein n=1 Tax=Lactuca virosa TaxID=75947 RepID=A0AAU9PBU4_9ASTR|nr:unnamed protein product [Lactuca virosa]